MTQQRRRKECLQHTKIGVFFPSSSWRFSWWVTLIIIILVPGLIIPTAGGGDVIQQQQQKFRRTPDNQTATIGELVTLACAVENKVGVLQWTRDGFGLGIDRGLEGYDRYSMVGSEEEGEYTLVIQPVTLEDDAVFQCQVGPGPNPFKAPPLTSTNAKLTVEVETGSPVILQGLALVTTEDRAITLECVSHGGKPPAEITWIDGIGQQLKSNVETRHELLEDGKRYNSRSILTLHPRKEHHNQIFSCQAHNHPAKQVQSSFIRLQVQYAPKIHLKIAQPTPSQIIKEFDNVQFSCEADGNPSNELNYTWFLNDVVIVGNVDSKLTILNISRTSHHQAIIKCQVANSIGQSQQSQIINISYGPSFRNRPVSVEADFGSRATLFCDVDGNPIPEIVWFHEATRIAVSTSSNLTVIVTHETAGPYICQAVVPGYPGISASASILLKGPPKVFGPRIVLFDGAMQESSRIDCLVKSIPAPEKVSWSHFDRSIDQHDLNYDIVQEPIKADGLIKNTLIIKKTQDKDFGPYNCSVTNAYGTSTMEIYLKRQENGGHIFIIIALTSMLIGGVVIVVAITMVVCLLCRRRHSRKQQNSDGMTKNKQDASALDNQVNKYNDNDNLSADSDLKVEIRTCSSLSNIQQDEEQDDSEQQQQRYWDETIGYIPCVNSKLDYNPPLQSKALNSIDLCYSATYGNTYLSSSFYNPLLLPQPPPYHHHHHYQLPSNQSQSNSHSNLTLNLYNGSGGSGGGGGGAAVPQVLPKSPSQFQYIIPSSQQSQLKPGTLATHV